MEKWMIEKPLNFKFASLFDFQRHFKIIRKYTAHLLFIVALPLLLSGANSCSIEDKKLKYS